MSAELEATRRSKVMGGIGHVTPWIGFMIPIVSLVPTYFYWLWRRNKSEFENTHIRAALNFQLGMQFLVLVLLFLSVILIVGVAGKEFLSSVTRYAGWVAYGVCGMAAIGSWIGFGFALCGRPSPYPRWIGTTFLK
ncbi:MAG: DUF4870 domain-containing protein [Verrucomicrobiota bacterium]